MSYRIPFNRPYLTARDLSCISECFERGHISGDGDFTRRCHHILEGELGVGRALLTTSCTHALEMSAILLNLQPGDEVIFPTFTFVSTVNAFLLRGIRPVFVDIRPDTLNLDEEQIEAKISPKTRAIVPVHYAGVGCEMSAIMRIAADRELAVVEDNAHGLFGRYRGKYLGTFGQFSTLSFHETKNFSCGEGGALLINDPAYFSRAEIIREKGTNRSQFFRGEVDRYTWVDIGSSYLPSDILSAMLWSQLERSHDIQERRKSLWHHYHDRLRPVATSRNIRMPHVPPDRDQAYHMFYLLMPSFEDRQNLIAYLKERGICAVFHYVPLHCSPMGLRFGGYKGQCPVAEDVSDRLVRLPFFNGLSNDDQDVVVQCITEFLERHISPLPLRRMAASAASAGAGFAALNRSGA